MSDKVLSKIQQELVILLFKNKSCLYYQKYINKFSPAYYFESETFKRFKCSTVDSLLKRWFLIHKRKDVFDDGQVFLTVKGRKAVGEILEESS